MILGMAAIMAACGDKSQNSGMNSGENTEENAGGWQMKKCESGDFEFGFNSKFFILILISAS